MNCSRAKSLRRIAKTVALGSDGKYDWKQLYKRMKRRYTRGY